MYFKNIFLKIYLFIYFKLIFFKLFWCIDFKNNFFKIIKKIILIYLYKKSTLKNNRHNHTLKHIDGTSVIKFDMATRLIQWIINLKFDLGCVLY